MGNVLNPTLYRATTGETVTRANIDKLLDARQIECAMNSGKWWSIRRNGATRRWKRDTSRIYVPFKYGMYGYGNITEADFV